MYTHIYIYIYTIQAGVGNCGCSTQADSDVRGMNFPRQRKKVAELLDNGLSAVQTSVRIGRAIPVSVNKNIPSAYTSRFVRVIHAQGPC